MLRKAFDMIDFDGSDTIDYEDWKELFLKLRPDLPEEIVSLLYGAGGTVDSNIQPTMNFKGL